MNRKTIVQLLLLFTVSFAYSQQTDELSCKEKVSLAEDYFTGNNNVIKNPDKGFSLLQKCIDDYEPDALHFLALLYLGAYDYFPVDEVTAFSFMNEAAQKGHADAACNLAILYKMGRGTKLDFDKAIEWHEKAYKLGSDKAAFKLGYMYFKGLGSVDQDFSTALEWFKKSDYELSKHFIAICNYFGFGMPIDKQQALTILRTNNMPGSKVLFDYLSEKAIENKPLENVEENKEISHTINNSITKQLKENNSDIEELFIDINKLEGSWKGKLVEFDWSGEKILRSFPVALNFDLETETKTIDYTWLFQNTEQKSYAIPLDNSIYFDNLNMKLKRLYPDAMGYDTLNYTILSADITKKKLLGKEYLIFDLDTQVLNWKEPGSPMQLILEKTQTLSDNGVVLNDELLKSLASNKDGFISLYPNPFVNDLLIEYELKKASNINITIHSYMDQSTITLDTKSLQNTGKHIYHLDGSNLKPGLYIVKVTTDDQVHTKIIVKEN